jgi:hypothetical protein
MTGHADLPSEEAVMEFVTAELPMPETLVEDL